jgi:hypothetical protein
MPALYADLFCEAAKSNMPLAQVKRKIQKLENKIQTQLGPKMNPVTGVWDGGRGAGLIEHTQCSTDGYFSRSANYAIESVSTGPPNTWTDASAGVFTLFRKDIGAPNYPGDNSFFWFRQSYYIKTDVDDLGEFTEIPTVNLAKTILLPYSVNRFQVDPVKRRMKPGFYTDCYGNPLDE